MLVGIERSAMAATQSGRVAGSIWKRLRRIVLELRSTIRLDASARRDAQIFSGDGRQGIGRRRPDASICDRLGFTEQSSVSDFQQHRPSVSGIPFRRGKPDT